MQRTGLLHISNCLLVQSEISFDLSSKESRSSLGYHEAYSQETTVCLCRYSDLPFTTLRKFKIVAQWSSLRRKLICQGTCQRHLNFTVNLSNPGRILQCLVKKLRLTSSHHKAYSRVITCVVCLPARITVLVQIWTPK